MTTPVDQRRPRAQKAARLACVIASFVVLLAEAIESAVTYPLTLPLDARAATATTTIASTVTIRVDRLMEENRRVRVTDALKYNGYSGFLNALRTLPAVGTIQVSAGTVDLKYAREQPDGSGSRLVLVADRPLFFLAGTTAKRREGYELTIVDLRLDAQGAVTGTMSGAARVKPAPDGGVVLDDFAEAPVQLTSRTQRP